MNSEIQALPERLHARCRELNELIRRYPSPIARCDDQLPKFIALRNAAAALLREPEGDAEWSRRASALLEEIEA
jgi:hypothetical protein